jgi:hypothetical protein
MRTEIRTRQIEILLPGSVAALILIGIIVGISTGDPEWLKRFGALIAAVAAGAILLQVRTEMKIEEERKRLGEGTDQGDMADATSPMGALEHRLAAKRLERMQLGLTATRLKVAGYVVSCAIVGELLHGFGDLPMRYVLAVYPAHAVCPSHEAVFRAIDRWSVMSS